MTTKLRRGRDPEQNEIHTVGTEADNYLGIPGQVTLVRNGGTITGMVLHDGTTRGGNARIGALPATADGVGAAPLLADLEVTLVSATPFVITHNLGYRPIVQVLIASTGVVQTDVTITHTSANALTLTRATGVAVRVLLR